MERVFTNRAMGWRGKNVCVTARLPAQIVEFMDEHLTSDLANRGEIVQHAVAEWALKTEQAEKEPISG